MAGKDSDHGVMARRLRGREIPVLTRSTVSSANGHVNDSENVLRKESKAPNKRAAMDEFNAKAPNVGSKKRAALANLTNHSSSSSSRQVAQIANKSQVHCDHFPFLFCLIFAMDLFNSLNDITHIHYVLYGENSVFSSFKFICIMAESLLIVVWAF